MVSKNEVSKIADLAKLDFDHQALEDFVPSFQQILDFFEQLGSVETGDVEPTYHALFEASLETPLREDRVSESTARAEVLDYAPEAKDGQLRVPKVIE